MRSVTRSLYAQYDTVPLCDTRVGLLLCLRVCIGVSACHVDICVLSHTVAHLQYYSTATEFVLDSLFRLKHKFVAGLSCTLRSSSLLAYTIDLNPNP